MSNRPAQDRGVALILVLVVLAALLSMAIPFSWSMKNASESADASLRHTETTIDLRGAFDLACSQLEMSHAAVDKTPQADGESDFKIDLPLLMKRYEVDQSNPSLPSDKIWSASVTDLQGRIDLNAANLYTVANAMNAASFLEKDIDDRPDIEELSVTDPGAFPEKGIVWIEGELFLYEAKRGSTLVGVRRAFVTPARPAPANRRRAHAEGAPVVDYRAYLLATYLYRAAPGHETSLGRLEDLKLVSKYGELPFGARDLERMKGLATVFGSRPGPRFANPQIVVSELKANDTAKLTLLNGRHFAPGSIVRLKNAQGVTEHNVVVASVKDGELWSVELELPVAMSCRKDEAVLESLTPAPVNVNTASRDVLLTLLRGLQLQGLSEARLLDTDAANIADAIVRQRPLNGFADLDRLFGALQDSGVVTKEKRLALTLNAYAPDAALAFSTQPFTFASGNLFELSAAVSDNYPPLTTPQGRTIHSGLEKARRFAREIVSVAPPGTLNYTLLNQRDFLENDRLTRLGRYWSTRPRNATLWDDYNYPPREEFAMRPGAIGNLATESADGVGATLQPARLNLPRTVHFDEGDLRSLDPEGWDVQKQWQNGERLATLDLRTDPVSTVSTISGADRMAPFAISMWWTPKNLSGEHVLFDTGVADVEDRVALTFSDGQLVFRVFDHSLPFEYETNHYTIGEWRYAFDDGLELKKNQPYYVSVYVKGNAPGEMVMFVDGVPRGRAANCTRLKSDMPGKSNNGLTALLGDPAFQVKSTDTFPPGPDVIRIGSELVEYTRAIGRKRDKDNDAGMEPSFDLTAEGVKEVIEDVTQGTAGISLLQGVLAGVPGTEKKTRIAAFGGRGSRNTAPVSHKAESFVSLYGYSARLISEKIPTGDVALGGELAPFYVARIDWKTTAGFKDINYKPQQGQGTSFTLGTGLPNNERIDQIPVAALWGENDTNLAKGFQREGGYVLVVTLPVGTGGGRLDLNGRSEEFDESRSSGRVGGAEVMHYSRFDGSVLRDITRGKSMAGYQKLGGGTNQAGDLYVPAWHIVNTNENWGFTAGQQGGKTETVPRVPGTFLIPISIKIPNTNLSNLYADPSANTSGQRGQRCELVQIDLDFKPGDTATTEWVRYNTIVNDAFVRSDPDAINRVATLLVGWGINPNANGERPKFYDTLIYRWRIADNNKRTQKDAQLLTDNINFEHLFQDPNSRNMLAFRGCFGTRNATHSAGAKVLPVIWFRSVTLGSRTDYAHPGRHDRVTLISSEEVGTHKDRDPTGLQGDEKSEPREHAEINYAWCGLAEDRGRPPFLATLVAFRAGVNGQYYRSYRGRRANSSSADEDVALGLMAQAVELADSCGFTRMVKFPSGELPAELKNDQRLVIGSDYQAKQPIGDMVVDEVRFTGPEYFNGTAEGDDLFKSRRYILARQLKLKEEDDLEDQKMYLRRYGLRFPHLTLDRDFPNVGPVVEAYRAVEHLPDDGGFLWVDDELIAYSAKKYDDQGATGELALAPSGRALFGTERGVHDPGAEAIYLPFCLVSRLQRGITKTQAAIPLEDADGNGIGEKPTDLALDQFPREGTVLIDQELVHYDRREGDSLILAQKSDDLGLDTPGLWRGRFGTPAQSHDEKTLVYYFPFRYWDRFVAGEDHPQLSTLTLQIAARQALYRKMSWGEELPNAQVDLVCQVRVGGRGKWTDPPGTSPDLIEFKNPEQPNEPNVIARQGDYLELRFSVRYPELAFDPLDFRHNEWKTTPVLKWVLVDYLEPRTVELYEEWR